MRVVVADDELLARQRLERLLAAIDGVELVASASGGGEALRLVREHAPDVVLLDIHMPDLSGLEVATLLDGETAVVFVTAHAEHALAAFGVAAVDYLLKPVEAGRLKAALERVRGAPAIHKGAGGVAGGGGASVAARLPVKTAKGLVLLDPADITHATLDGELVTIHTDERTWLSDWSLNALEERLPERFVRASRQALLNLDRVELLEPTDSGGYLAKVRGGALIAVSRQAARKLRRDLGV